MGLFNMGINKPKQFNHIPIYYDPEKEQLEKVRKEADEGNIKEDGEYHVGIRRGSFRKVEDRNDVFSRIAEHHREIVKLSVLLFVLVLIGIFVYVNGGQLISLYLG